MTLQIYLVVMIGSAIGGAVRYGLTALMTFQFGYSFPWGTVLVNITGSFVIGFLAGLNGPGGRALLGPVARQFALTGLCGGYTTFSAFSLQTFELIRADDWLRAGGNVAGSVVLCLMATWLGHMAAVAVNQARGA